MQKILRKSNKQKGQAVLEYIILTALVGIFCLTAVKRIGKSMNTRLKQIDKKITKQIDI